MKTHIGKSTWLLVSAAWAVILLLIILAGLNTSTPTLSAPTVIYTLSGRVYVGETGAEPPVSTPLSDVVVSLYCAYNADEVGRFVLSTTTDSTGWYGLDADSTTGCGWFNIIETDPPGYTSNGATTVSGSVRSANWIAYDASSLDQATLTGNKFWDNPPPTTITCTSCADCQAKLDGTYRVVSLTNDINTSSSSCIVFGGDNVTFDCQGHAIRTQSHGEFSYGIRLTNRQSDTVRNCTISGFHTGIDLYGTTHSHFLTNTITGTVQGIALHNSLTNTFSGNQITNTTTGIWIGGSNGNTLTHNRICHQSSGDIYVSGITSGNVRMANTCDSIYNWNGSNSVSLCDSVCTPNTSTTCSTASDCEGKLNGSYGTVILGADVHDADGLTIGGNNLTLDCNYHAIRGSGQPNSVGILLRNRVGVHIRRCNIYSYTVGIDLDSSSLNTITGSKVMSNAIGVRIFTTTLPSQQNEIRENTIHRNSLYGVELIDVSNNTIQSNNFADNGEYALWVDHACSNDVESNMIDIKPLLYWSDSTISRTLSSDQYGLIFFCNVRNATIRGTTVANSAHHNNNGVLIVDSGNITMTNNLVRYSNGIYVRGSDHVRVYTNTVEHNRHAGILFENSPVGEIRNNRVQHNNLLSDSFGISVIGGSDWTVVVSNTLTDNSQGIGVQDSDAVVLNQNLAYSNHGDGMAIRYSNGGHIEGNTVVANQHGLYMDAHTSNYWLQGNEVCRNQGQDIFNDGTDNTGSNNTCAFTWWWHDNGVSSGCNSRCVGWYNRGWGFGFHNISVDDLPWRRYEETFGKDEVDVTVKLCIGVPVCIPFKCWCLGKKVDIETPVPDPFAALLYAFFYQDIAEPGSCFGMSAKSLQFFYGDDNVSNYDSSAAFVRDLHSDNGSLATRREILQGSQMSTEAIDFYIAELLAGHDSANYVLEAARNGLAADHPNFVIIKNGLTDGHAMNYDTVVDVNANTSRIYVYDNNKEQYVNNVYPWASSYPAIVIDRAADQWSYDMGSTTWSGDDPIFDFPYSLVNRTDWTLPGSANGILNYLVGDSAYGNIEDMSGNLLGYDESGTPHEEIPHGMGYPLVGATLSMTRSIFLVQPGDYNMNVYGGGTYSMYITGLNGGYILGGIPLGSGAHDYLELRTINGNPYNHELSFETADPAKPLDVLLFRSWDPDADRRYYHITNLDLDNDGRVLVKVLADHSGIAISNRGADPFTYDAEFSNEMVRAGGSPLGQVPTVQITGLALDPGKTATLVPTDWGDLSSAGVEVQVTTCGDAVCEGGEDHINCPADCAPLACQEPHDDMHVTGTTLLCGGTYELADQGEAGVIIVDDGATLDCNGAHLIGDGGGIGILSEGTQSVTIENCYVERYATGIVMQGVGDGTLSDSMMTANSDWGLVAENAPNLSVRQNYIVENAGGIHLLDTDGVAVERNYICANDSIDIHSEVNGASSGAQNACGTAEGWLDEGGTPCEFQCTVAGQILNPSIYLPLVIRNDH